MVKTLYKYSYTDKKGAHQKSFVYANNRGEIIKKLKSLGFKNIRIYLSNGVQII